MVFLQKKKKQLILDIKLNKMRNLQSFRTLWVVAGQTVLALRLKEKKIDFYNHFQIEARFIRVIGSFVIS